MQTKYPTIEGYLFVIENWFDAGQNRNMGTSSQRFKGVPAGFCQ